MSDLSFGDRGLPADEVDHLLLNARLRDELEPFFDDSIDRLNRGRLSLRKENEYLASMLAWERAPVVPIAQWFEPALNLPSPDELSDSEVHRRLWSTIHQLFQKRVVLEFTDHLPDRQLYCVICRDILPSPEKKLERPAGYLYWNCAESDGDPEIWLTYYASDEEREGWLESELAQNPLCSLPPAVAPPYPRNLPCPQD